MIVLVATFKVKAGHVAEVLAVLDRMAPLVRSGEPDCAMYQVSQSTEDPDMVLLYEQYVDDAAVRAHRETAHFKELIEGKVVPLLDRRDRAFYELVIP